MVDGAVFGNGSQRIKNEKGVTAEPLIEVKKSIVGQDLHLGLREFIKGILLSETHQFIHLIYEVLPSRICTKVVCA